MGILLGVVIRTFSVISRSHISKLLELRFGKAMLFKNYSLSESDFRIRFKKAFVKMILFTFAPNITQIYFV